MAFPRDEVRATIERYHELRRRIDEGLEPNAFGALADFYTDDAVYVDGAWGRLEGKRHHRALVGRLHAGHGGLEVPDRVHGDRGR